MRKLFQRVRGLLEMDNSTRTRYPIYIPSKGRADNCLTAKMLIDQGCETFSILVEPQDRKAYEKAYGKDRIKVLPRNNKRISYARRQAKRMSVEQGDKFHWQIDDDMIGFYLREGKKSVKVDVVTVLRKAEKFVDKYTNIGIAGTSHNLWAWSRKGEYGLNKLTAQCVIVRNSLKIDWPDDTIEDVDYSLKVLNYEDRSWCTVLFYKLLHNAAPNNTGEGGAIDVNRVAEAREKRAQAIINSWPESFKIGTDKDGMAKLKASRVWMTFKQQLVRR